MARVDMPWTEPEDWRAKRRNASWGIFFLTIVVASSTQWLAQVVGGAIVGANVGLDGLRRISAAEFDNLNLVTTWSSIIITVLVTGYAVVCAREDLAWNQTSARMRYQWGIEWWPHFWRPILIGTLVHGLLFSGLMYGSASV